MLRRLAGRPPAQGPPQPDPYAQPDPFADPTSQPKTPFGLFDPTPIPPPRAGGQPDDPFLAYPSHSQQNSISNAPAACEPSSLEVFWGVISCNPVAPQTLDTGLSVPAPNYMAAERARLTGSSSSGGGGASNLKRLSDLDLINQRLREAALRRKKDRKDTNEEDLLGEDVAAARRKLMQEEQFKKDKQAEFQKTQQMQRDALEEQVDP